MYFYIDPGTGSMLFTILIGLLSAAVYVMRGWIMKVRFILDGGKAEKRENEAEPLVIFTDSKRYWNLFEPILDALEAREQRTLYLTCSADDPALEKPYHFIRREFAGEGNRAYARMNMIKAKVVFSSTPGLEVYQWKRSREVKWYVHIPHQPNDMTTYRMFGIDYYDAIMLSGLFQGEQVRKLEKLRGLPPKDLPLVGLPYLDTLANRLSHVPKQENHPRTVLLAPSWGPTAIFSRFGGRIIQALLDTGDHIIVRPHPQSFVSEKEQMDALMLNFPPSEQLEWDRSTDNFDSLNRADLLISDFSGVMFDFTLIFDKPILYVDVSFDDSVYDAWWLEEELWTFQILNHLGQQLTEEDLPHIGDKIEACISDNTLREGRALVRDMAWVNRGKSAQMAAEYLIDLCRKDTLTMEQAV